MPRKWGTTKVHPADILSAFKTLSATSDWRFFDLYFKPTPDWTEPATYLAWAQRSLQAGDEFGWDATITYAKRAACRRIDGFLRANHLGRYHDKGLALKIEVLKEIDLVIPQVVKDLIVSRRNDIEHSYQEASSTSARHALEIADMFLQTTEQEARWLSRISFGPGIIAGTPPPDGGFNPEISGDQPMFLIDPTPPEPKAMILHPKDDQIEYATLASFDRVDLASMSRALRAARGKVSTHSMHLDPAACDYVMKLLGVR
jgi:hypothetical protein